MITPAFARRALYLFALIIPAWGYSAYRYTSLYIKGRERLATYLPVRVAILQSGIASRTGTLGLTYWEPRVEYAVRTPKGTFIAQQVTPLNEAYTKKWAQGISDRYKVGLVDTGYVSPDTLRRSFLVPHLGYFWHITMFIGVAIFGAFGWLWQRARRSAAASPLTARTDS